MIYNFFIINSSGSMIYSFQVNNTSVNNTSANYTSVNKLLVLCGSLHSVSCMAKEVSSSNPLIFKYTKKIISIYKTETNLSFVFVSDSHNQDHLFEKIHSDFCDFVMLNPFYILDMPINCEKFNPGKYFNIQ